MLQAAFHKILDFYRSGPDRPVEEQDPEAIRREYERRRWGVFLSITLGYGAFYLGRINLSVVKKPLLDQGILSATELGAIGSAMLVIYAVGKLVNGFLADRSNIRRFMATGLTGIGIANLVLGWSTVFGVFMILWGVNGWFQSMGSAPSVVAMSHWFSPRERGTRYGIWSVAHSLGEGLTFLGTSFLVSEVGWKWGFWGPGLFCMVGGLILSRTLADRPQTYGLPHVTEYRDDGRPDPPKPVGLMQREALTMPAVWILALSSASMYVARYGINNWGLLFLQETKGYGMAAAGAILSANPVAGIAGAASSGWISDRFFGSRRNVPLLIFGLLEIASLWAFATVPGGHPALDTALMGLFGFSIGGLLVFLGGLMAVDLVPQRATGAAMGIIGLFSYLGAAIQDGISGHLLDVYRVGGAYDFGPLFYFWIGASVLSMLLALSVWRSSRPS